MNRRFPFVPLRAYFQAAHARIVRFLEDRSGATAVLVALSMTAILGTAGLAVNVGVWYLSKRNMQGAADSAAFSAGTALANGASKTIFTTEAKTVAAQYGLTDGSDGVTVSVNNPPLTGPNSGNSSAVEVIISQPRPLGLAALFQVSEPTVAARAVTIPGPGNGCILTLDSGKVVDLGTSGGTQLNLTGCDLYINSSDSDALNMSGGSTITANNAYIVGNYSTSGGAKLNATAHTGVPIASDPYANVDVPTYSSCNSTNYSLSGGSKATINASATTPYVFCQGLQLSGGASLTLGPGIYIINRGQLSISGGTTLTATQGTTIILTSSTGAAYATASISGGGVVKLTAPSTGTTAGLAIYQDRRAPTSGSNTFSGGSTQNITGAIYFPSQSVSYSGGSSSGGSTCTQLIAYQATFSGGSNFSNSNCTGVGVSAIGSSGVKLAE